MDFLLKFATAYLLGPALLVGLAFALHWLVPALVAVAYIAAALLFAGIVRSLARYAKNRLSPVRRRHPRPAAWYQWQ